MAGGQPGEITAWEVVGVLGGSFFPENFCEDHPGVRRDCVHTPNCSVRALWRSVESAVRDVLVRITLADLGRQEQDFAVWIDDSMAAPAPETQS